MNFHIFHKNQQKSKQPHHDAMVEKNPTNMPPRGQSNIEHNHTTYCEHLWMLYK